MSRKKSYLTVTDLFCGAGGSSQGAFDAGAEVRMAVNHWKLAVETHNSNFPDTDHDCANISQTDPDRYPSTDILIASPECTTHSLAKGKKRKQQGQLGLWENKQPDPAEVRSRATMYDVPRFAEIHDYGAIIVENVVDIMYWPPFQAWLQAMASFGYEHKLLFLNSQFFWPTPQSRDRIYIVFWKKGLPRPNLEFRPLAYCPKCGKDVEAIQSWKNPTRKWGRYGKRNQYVYRCPTCAEMVNPYYYPASSAIDWSILGGRIGDRKVPLRPRTMERIRYGLRKFGQQALTVQLDYTHSESNRTRPVGHTLPTQTSRQVLGLLSPFILEYYSRPNAAGGIDEPLSTIVTENRHALVQPFLTSLNHSGDRARSINAPLPTQTSVNAPYLVTPHFLFNYYGARHAVRGAGEPLATATSWLNHALIQHPAFIAEFYGNGTARSVDDPLSTLMAQVNHHGLIQPPAFFIKYYGSWNHTIGVGDPLDSITTIDHHGLVQMLVSYYGQDAARPVTEPMGTLTTVDRHAMVEAPSVDPEDCYFRMLTPEEVKLGMAFPGEYVILGNSRDRVKQAGNAVTPPVMKWLFGQVAEVFR